MNAPGVSRVGALGLDLLAGAVVLLAVALAQSSSAGPQVQTQALVTGLANPLYLTHAGDQSGRLFVVEQAGTIRVVRGGRLLPAPFLDIRSRVISGGELGLLSVAFHPRYTSNGRLFVNYTARQGTLRTVVAEYRVSRNDSNRADRSERVILEIEQPYTNHNGGLNLFGPDGMLYIGMGDGGSGGDPHDNGQRLESLLGKLLRIDVDGGPPYGIPAGNPFLGRAVARDEIWAYGLRNPWRFSFDRPTGRLFLGDVGQNAWEEIDLIERGQNYGWRIMEGAHCFNPRTNCDTSGLTLPIAEYANGPLGCSVTGGHVYRGGRIRTLVGRYLFGDYCSGRVWSLTETRAGRWSMASLLETGLRISSFGEDQSGELYVIDHRGVIHGLVPR
ncbi:MAG: PQQ-dependent sugar dehydrogenase [Armatimonadota bacterium]